MSSHTSSIQETLQRRLDAHPDGRALAFFESSRAFQWQSFATIVERSAGVQQALFDAGIQSGDVVVIVMSDPACTSPVLLGTFAAGGIPLLVASPMIQGSNSSLPDIVAGVIRKTDARIVVYADAQLASDLHPQNSTMARSIAASEIPGAPGAVTFAVRSFDSVGAMQLTSGTTGFPRICVWTHRKIQAALDGMAQAMDLGGDDTFLNWTPLYHDMGLINNWMLCLLHQIPLVLMSPFDMMRHPALWLQAISDTKATTSWSPNFAFALATQRCSDQDLDGVTLQHVRGLWNAAERIHYRTIVEFQRRFEPYGLSPNAMKTNFGCAENIGGATFSDPHGSFKVEMLDREALYERVTAVPTDRAADAIPVVSVGKAHPGITIHILDDQGHELPDGHIGAVALKTASRMEEYFGEPEETAQAFHGELLKTGDLGYQRDGELFWTGRTRECITFRGRKIDPSDFEAALLEVPDLRPGCFVAFGVDDTTQGTEQIVIVAEARDEPRRPLSEIQQDVAAAIMAQFGLLRISDFVLVRRGSLTKTSSGKRRHRHFRSLYLQGNLAPFRVEFDEIHDATSQLMPPVQ